MMLGTGGETHPRPRPPWGHEFVRRLTRITGKVISSFRRSHRAMEFQKSLSKINSEIIEGLEAHLICNNHATHKYKIIMRWPDK